MYTSGLEPKGQTFPEGLAAIQERGLSMDGQFSKSVSEYLGKNHFAHTITVGGDTEQNCPAVFLNMGKHEHWPLDDPAKFQGESSQKLDFTRTVRDQIDRHVRQWLKEQNIQPALP